MPGTTPARTASSWWPILVLVLVVMVLVAVLLAGLWQVPLQLSEPGRWAVGVLAMLSGSFLVWLGIALFRGQRRCRAEDAHLALHGIDSHARVVGLVRTHIRVNQRRAYDLQLRWTDPASGRSHDLKSGLVWLDIRQHAHAVRVIDTVGDVRVRLDPRDPVRYHRAGDTKSVQALLQGAT